MRSFKISRLPTALLGLVLSSMFCAPASALPRGAVALDASKRFAFSGVQCGRIEEFWLPGSVSGQFFIAHTQRVANLRKRARETRVSALKRRLKQRAMRWQRRHERETATCCNGPRNCQEQTEIVKTALKFDFSLAKGLVLVDQENICLGRGEAHSNLRVIKEDASLVDALREGVASVRSFQIAANGKIYVEFSQDTRLDPSSPTQETCAFAEIEKSGSSPRCIVAGSNSSFGLLARVQFDSNGTAYFPYYADTAKSISVGIVSDSGIRSIPSVGQYVLTGFSVLPDGRMLLLAPQVQGGPILSRVKEGENIQAVELPFPRSAPSGMHLFPDGNVYFGVSSFIPSAQNATMLRYLSQSDALDAAPWIARQSAQPAFAFETFCSPGTEALSSFCGDAGTHIRSMVTTSNGKVFAVAGSQVSKGSLMQFYPEVAAANSGISSFLGLALYADKVLSAGNDAQNHFVFDLLDHTAGSRERVADLGLDKDTSHFGLVSGTDDIFYAAYDRSIQKYIIGKLNLVTAAQSVKETNSGAPLDLQVF